MFNLNHFSNIFTVDMCKMQLTISKNSVKQGDMAQGKIKIVSNKKENKITSLNLSLIGEYFTENMVKESFYLYTYPLIEKEVLYPYDEKELVYQFPIHLNSIITSSNVILSLKAELDIYKSLPIYSYCPIQISPSNELQEILNIIQYDFLFEPTYISGSYTERGQIFDYHCSEYYQRMGISQISFIFNMDNYYLPFYVRLQLHNGKVIENQYSWIRSSYQQYNGVVDKNLFKKQIYELLMKEISRY